MNSNNGGIGIGSNNILFENYQFINNRNGLDGGALSILNGSQNITVRNCKFEGNSAEKGGGLFVEKTTNVSLININFSSNEAS